MNSLIRNKVSQEFIEKAVSEAVENAAVDLPETTDCKSFIKRGFTGKGLVTTIALPFIS